MVDSKILKLETEEGQEQFAFLKQSLNNPKRLQLLFRASEHDFKAKRFHQKCDGVHGTLTLVKTEFGKTIAGYSYYRWN